jgi:small subunit ribosomal protein S6
MQRVYETLYVQHPETPTGRVGELNEKLRSVIASAGGEVLDFEEWGTRELAYPIRHQKRGLYFLVRFRGEGSVVEELERNLKITDEVLRFITVRVPARAATSRSSLKRQDAKGQGATDLNQPELHAGATEDL